MSYEEGTKYRDTKDLPITEVAKLIRKDLKEHYPQYKSKVQVEKYSMGCTIHAQLVNTGIERDTATYSDTKDTVQRIMQQYGFNDSDWQSDYHATRFYTDVRIES